jgi:hypothetical protein
MGKKTYYPKFPRGPCAHVYAVASGKFSKGDLCMADGRVDIDGICRCYKHRLVSHTVKAIIRTKARLLKDLERIKQAIVKLKSVKGLAEKAAKRFGTSWDSIENGTTLN